MFFGQAAGGGGGSQFRTYHGSFGHARQHQQRQHHHQQQQQQQPQSMSSAGLLQLLPMLLMLLFSVFSFAGSRAPAYRMQQGEGYATQRFTRGGGGVARVSCMFHNAIAPSYSQQCSNSSTYQLRALSSPDDVSCCSCQSAKWWGTTVNTWQRSYTIACTACDTCVSILPHARCHMQCDTITHAVHGIPYYTKLDFSSMHRQPLDKHRVEVAVNEEYRDKLNRDCTAAEQRRQENVIRARRRRKSPERDEALRHAKNFVPHSCKELEQVFGRGGTLQHPSYKGSGSSSSNSSSNSGSSSSTASSSEQAA
eukprot:6958-Heterococcus_DN1.PRE.1